MRRIPLKQRIEEHPARSHAPARPPLARPETRALQPSIRTHRAAWSYRARRCPPPRPRTRSQPGPGSGTGERPRVLAHVRGEENGTERPYLEEYSGTDRPLKPLLAALPGQALQRLWKGSSPRRMCGPRSCHATSARGASRHSCGGRLVQHGRVDGARLADSDSASPPGHTLVRLAAGAARTGCRTDRAPRRHSLAHLGPRARDLPDPWCKSVAQALLPTLHGPASRPI